MKNKERLDDLLIGGLKLWQNEDEFCFSIDAILLVHFAVIKSMNRYADLGTGTGVIPLLLSHLGATRITAFELNPVTVDLAKRNVEMNGLTEKIMVIECDYRQCHDKKLLQSFDGILVNPPYQENGRGTISAKEHVALALHEVETTLDEVVLAAKRLLRYGGKLWMVHAAHRVTDIMTILRKYNLEPKRMRFVHSCRKREARLVLVEAMYGAKAGIRIEAPLYIYEDMKLGIYTDEVNSYYEK